MKTLMRILALVLVLSGLMPLMATFFAATDQLMIMEMFHFTGEPNPELQLTFVMLGSALIFASVIQFLAAVWVWKNKIEGVKLSIGLAIVLIASGGYIFAVLSTLGINDPSLYAPDLFKGSIILLLSVVALKRRNKL